MHRSGHAMPTDVKTQTPVNVHASSKNYTWPEAKNACQMIGSEVSVNISRYYAGLMWTNAVPVYTPWLEYLGCYSINETQIIKTESRKKNKSQLRDCIQTCRDEMYIGLQQSSCFCLKSTPVESEYILSICDTRTAKTTCIADDEAFCAKDNSNTYSVYRKVSIQPVEGIGNCLTLEKNSDGSYTYKALNCYNAQFSICSSDIYQNNFAVKTSNMTWISSSTSCPVGLLSTYSALENYNSHKFIDPGMYWVNSMRRYQLDINPAITSKPKNCIATFLYQNGTTGRYYDIYCNRKFPALCISGLTETTTDLTPRKNTISRIIIAVAISGAVVLVVIIIVFVICRKKKHGFRSVKKQQTQTQDEVMYSEIDASDQQQENKDGVIVCKTNDTYDHMNHFRSERNGDQMDTEYDTMQAIASANEDHYDHTDETNKQLHITDGEYSQNDFYDYTKKSGNSSDVENRQNDYDDYDHSHETKKRINIVPDGEYSQIKDFM